MTGALWVALLAAPGADLDFEAASSKAAEGFELRLVGRARGLPEGTAVRLRFRRLVNRAEGPLIAQRPEAAARVRWVEVRKGTFSHHEAFPAPADVEVEASIDLAEPSPAVKVVRVGSPSDTAAALRREVRALREWLAEARRYGGEGGREGARRRLAALRGEESSALFTATPDRLAGVLEKFLASGPREAGAPRFNSRPLGLAPEDLPAALDGVEDVLSRERVILLVREAARMRGTDRALAALEGAAEGDEPLRAFLREAGGEGFGHVASDIESRFRQGWGWPMSGSYQEMYRK